jgi:signal transduction histidine kinase
MRRRPGKVRMLKTLRARLIAGYIGVVVLGLVLAGGVFILLVQRVESDAVYRSLQTNEALLLPQLREALRGDNRARIVTALRGELARTKLRVLVLGPAGRVLNDTAPGPDDVTGRMIRLIPDRNAAPGDEQGMFLDAANRRWNYIIMTPPRQPPSPLPDNPPPGTDGTENPAPGPLTWVLAQRPPQIPDVWGALGRQLLLAGALALLVAVALGALLARSVALPVDRLSRAADEIARGNYAYQVQVNGSSELARLAERFNAMAAEVRTAHQMQRDFLANVSHDLKTPLTAIQGFSQAILDGAVQGQDGTTGAARIINTEARRMARMVSDLLDLARLESGQTALERTPVDPAGLLHQAAATVQLQAQEARVGLRVESGPLPLIQADPDRLRRALINLTDNALRHTPPGGSVTLRGEVGPQAVILSVRDTGQGIPPADLPHIFERFYQVDKSRSQARSTSGLGLAIVQQIVQAHDGTISVLSQVGVGTEFRMMLPMALASPAAGHPRLDGLKLPGGGVKHET